MATPTQCATAEPRGRDSAATRHLCAAAYLDDQFRERCLCEVYYQSHRAVAPSCGFSLVPVLWHCLRARNGTMLRDATVVGILVITAYLTFPAPALLAGWLSFLAVVLGFSRLMDNTRQRLRSRLAFTALRSEVMRLLGLNLLAVVLTMLLTGCVLVATSAWLAAMLTPTRPLTYRDVVDPTFLPICLVALVPVVAHRLWQQLRIDSLAPGQRVGEPPSTKRFAAIGQQQQSDKVIYSGYRPFIGSGARIHEWGFAGRLVRPQRPFGPPLDEADREFERAPFTAEQIKTYVAESLRKRAADPDPEREISGLLVRDRVFVSTQEERVSHLSEPTDMTSLAEIIRHPTTPTRHYLSCQVVSWNGELVTSVYVHFAVQGRALYLEVTATALRPCDDRYRVVDLIGGTGTIARLRAIGHGFRESPRAILAAPVNLINHAVDLLTSTVTRTAAAPSSEHGSYYFGARVSVRELAASLSFRDRMQVQDVAKHHKILERTVAAAVLDFLELHGVDTTEFSERTQLMLNQLNAGAVNTGSGSMYVEQAVGQQTAAAQPRSGANP